MDIPSESYTVYEGVLEETCKQSSVVLVLLYNLKKVTNIHKGANSFTVMVSKLHIKLLRLRT